MTKKEEYYKPVYNEDGKITSIKYGTYYTHEITSIEEVIQLLNEQKDTIRILCKLSSKLEKLLEENTKPTANHRG